MLRASAMHYFDYKKIADEAGLSPDQLQRLCKVIREEYPDDDMLYELHVLRACRALRDGAYSFEEIISGQPAQSPTSP
ncbi:hypothetical protein HY256_03710 [Candidatus Sumerlaeota bacterium]|nr:hypothetical protein [Candidatus Sumerlaeota bacterium]